MRGFKNPQTFNLYNIFITKVPIIMKSYKFIVEKTNTGFSAYAADDNLPVGTTGGSFNELKLNILDAINSYFEFLEEKEVTAEQITTQMDIQSFFEFYPEFNAKGLSKRINMNESLLSQYISGIKKPSKKQVDRILGGIKELGKEVSKLEFS